MSRRAERTGLVPTEQATVMGSGIGSRDRCYTVFLQGGLGNQMFQYAMARSLSLRHGAELRLDACTGFWIDRHYRRKFELGNFAAGRIHTRTIAGLRWLGARLVDKATRALGGSNSDSINRRLRVLCEASARRFVPVDSVGSGHWVLFGYWQSPQYFAEHALVIARDLSPPQPLCPRLLSLGHELRQGQTIAVGYRAYEESHVPEFHASDGRLKTLSELAKQVWRIKDAYPSSRCALFCTHTPIGLDSAGLPPDTRLIVPECVTATAAETMWLLCNCRHHVFSNSTFYWWGAWLSQYMFERQDLPRAVCAASNFKNEDCVPGTWQTF